MSQETKFEATFQALQSILEQHQSDLVVKKALEDHYYLNTPTHPQKNQEDFFGAAQIRKSYVSFYLMPVYCYPDLLENVSNDLKKHMQGKSCFNFKEIDETLFAELAQLVQTSLEKYKAEGYLHK